jgi:ADP-ribose pyrophosphatase
MPAGTIFEVKFLRLLRDGRWEWVERTRSSGVAIILPITADRKIILVEQHRPAVGKKVIALPAGIAGDKGSEEIVTAAGRELLEETGYACPKLTLLGEGPSSSGLTSEIVTFFLADPAGRRAPPNNHEGIEVHEVPLTGLHDWLTRRASAEGCLIDYKIFAALFLADQRA